MNKSTITDIKAYIYITEQYPDLTDLQKEQGIKIEYLNYKCSRQRDEWGTPFGTTKETIINFAAYCISDKLDNLYDRISSMELCSLTVVFNPIFGEDNRLKNYTRAFTATGYTISIEELAGFYENILYKRQLDNSLLPSSDRKDKFSKNSVIADSVTMHVKFVANEIRYFNEGVASEYSNDIIYTNY